MAKLPTFTAQAASGTAGGRRASAADFGAGAGRAAEGLGGQLQKSADLLKTQEESAEVRRVTLEAARLRAEQAQAIEAARLDGTDYAEVEKEFAGRLNEMDSLAKTTKGRQMVGLAQEQNRREFFGMVNRAKQTRAAEQASQEYVELMEVVGAGLAADPSLSEDYKAGLKIFTQSIVGISPEDRAAVYQKGAEQIDATAVDRFIQINPQFVLEQITTTNAWPNLSPQVRAAAMGRAKEKIFQEEMRVQAKARWDVYERTQRGKAVYVESMREILFPNEEGDRQQALDTAAQHPDLSGPQVNSLYQLNAALSKDVNQPVRSDPVKVRQLYERITAPLDSDRKIVSTEEIADAFIRQDISRSDLNWLTGVLETNADDAGRSYWDSAKPVLDAIRKRVDKTTLQATDPEGARLYSVFLKEFYDRYNKQRKEGKDPRDFLDPNSADYAGSWVSAQRRGGFEQIQGQMGEMLQPDVRKAFDEIRKGGAAGQDVVDISSGDDAEKVKPGSFYRFKGRVYYKSSTAPAPQVTPESDTSDFYDVGGN